MRKYRGRYFVREAATVCGEYLDADVFPVFQKPGARRKKSLPSSEVQEAMNQRRAERRITWLARNNFTPADLALHLTYDHVPTPEEAKRELRNYLSRVNAARRRAGLPRCRYLSCTERGERSGRVHHHLMISGGLSRDRMEELWGRGRANSRRLQFGEDGIAGLACYMAKRDFTYRRWNQSKNLILPETVPDDSRFTQDDLAELAEAAEAGDAETIQRLYPGWVLTAASAVRNPVNHVEYVRLEFRREQEGRRRC